MRIEQTLGGATAEGAAFTLHTARYLIEVKMSAQPEGSPPAEWGMQASPDNGANWQTAQETHWHGAEPVQRKIQADAAVAEVFSLSVHLMSAMLYRFTASSKTKVSIKLTKA